MPYMLHTHPLARTLPVVLLPSSYVVLAATPTTPPPTPLIVSCQSPVSMLAFPPSPNMLLPHIPDCLQTPLKSYWSLLFSICHLYSSPRLPGTCPHLPLSHLIPACRLCISNILPSKAANDPFPPQLSFCQNSLLHPLFTPCLHLLIAKA